MRAARDPFLPASAADTISRNLIATNTGNLLFSDASYRLLRTSGVDVVTNGPRLNGDDADPDLINAEFDHFVVPLANAFRPDFAKKWLPVLTSLIQRLRIPVTVLGVGAQASLDLDPSELDGIRDPVTEFMSTALDHGPSVGVRGEFTADYLASLGFAQTEVIGCPSMFLRGPDLTIRPFGEITPHSRIAMSLSNWVDGIGTLVDENLERYPELVYFAQELRDLELMHWGDTSAAQGSQATVPDALTHPLLADDRVRFHLSSPTWIADLAGFDCSVGTRIHATIASLLAGTPAHLICHDSRTLELARYFDLPHTPSTDLRPGLDLADLAHGDFDAMTRTHPARLERIVGFVRSHDLATVYDADGDRGSWFDTTTAATAYPDPATVWRGGDDGDLGYRIAWLRERYREQSRSVSAAGRDAATARRAMASADRKYARLSDELAATRSDLGALQKRVSAAEKVIVIPLSTRSRQGLRRRLGR